MGCSQITQICTDFPIIRVIREIGGNNLNSNISNHKILANEGVQQMNEPEYNTEEMVEPTVRVEEPVDDSNGWKDKYLRAVADMDNMRKRTAREKQSTINFAVQNFALELLPAKDAMERGLDAADTTAELDPAVLIEGLQTTLALLNKAFSDAGIEEINPVGQPFDPQFHEAVAVREVPIAAPHMVLTVFETGYLLNGKLLRPAKVEVSSE